MNRGKRQTLRTGMLLMGLTTGLAALVPAALSGAVRLGAGAGLAVAAVASASAIALLALSIDRGIKLVLGALVVGFLLRMLMVAAGLLLARSLGADLLAFACGFFALYLAHQLIEVVVVVRRAGSAAAEARA